MGTVRVVDHSQGVMVVIEEGVDAEGVDHVREFPLQAVAFFQEALGYADPVEALEAIIRDQDQRDEATDHDSEPWDDVMTLLTFREKEREDAALTVKGTPGATDQQVQVAAAHMAYRAVHLPVDGGDCVMDRCREAAREVLGLPAPSENAGAAARETTRVASGGFLADISELLEESRADMLHMLSGNQYDPLAGWEPEDPGEAQDPVAAVFSKYGGAQ